MFGFSRQHLVRARVRSVAVRDVGQVAGEEGEPRSRTAPVGSGHRGHGEPERVMDTGEDLGFVLEVVEREEPLAAERVGEEGRGGLVGREAGWA